MPTPRTAVVVDDEAMMRRLLRSVLEADDFIVVEAAGGVEALHVAGVARPAVIVLDVMMPDMDGVEVCRRLDHDAVKVVMLSAGDDPDLERRCREAGAAAFLTKPFSSIALLDLIGELVA